MTAECGSGTRRRRRLGEPAPGRRGAFTLVEMLMVVSIMAVVAGIVVILAGGIGRSSDERLAQAECADIRKACRQFLSDMGEPPRFLAELLQSPDPADALGGWWWRTTGPVPARLRSFDPATGRGWNGPYLRAEFLSSAGGEASEARVVPPGAYEWASSSAPAGKGLSILCSDYASFPQAKNGSALVSHYQLDARDAGELFVRFVRNPGSPPSEASVVARVGLGAPP